MAPFHVPFRSWLNIEGVYIFKVLVSSWELPTFLNVLCQLFPTAAALKCLGLLSAHGSSIGLGLDPGCTVWGRKTCPQENGKANTDLTSPSFPPLRGKWTVLPGRLAWITLSAKCLKIPCFLNYFVPGL